MGKDFSDAVNSQCSAELQPGALSLPGTEVLRGHPASNVEPREARQHIGCWVFDVRCFPPSLPSLPHLCYFPAMIRSRHIIRALSCAAACCLAPNLPGQTAVLTNAPNPIAISMKPSPAKPF